MKDDKFYVYVYFDPRKSGIFVYEDFLFEYEPFYVGKGCGNQCYSHLTESYNNIDLQRKTNKNRGTYKCNKIRKIKSEINSKPIIVKLYQNLQEVNAFDLEKRLIKIIGRFDLGKGPLTNLTDGGDGTSGYIYPKYLKKIRSEAIKGDKHMLRQPGVIHWNKGKTYDEIVGEVRAKELILEMSKRGKTLIGEKNPMFGKKQSEQTKNKIGAANCGENSYWFGKKFSPEHVEALSQSLKNCDKLKKPRPGLQNRILSVDTRRKIGEGVKKHYINGGKKIRVCGKDNPRSKSVIANFERFDSISSAAKRLGVSPSTVSYRVIKKFPGYSFVNGENIDENTIKTESP